MKERIRRNRNKRKKRMSRKKKLKSLTIHLLWLISVMLLVDK